MRRSTKPSAGSLFGDEPVIEKLATPARQAPPPRPVEPRIESYRYGFTYYLDFIGEPDSPPYLDVEQPSEKPKS